MRCFPQLPLCGSGLVGDSPVAPGSGTSTARWVSLPMKVHQRASLEMPAAGGRSSKKWLPTPPLRHPLCQVPPISSSSHPPGCCAWPGPTSPLTLTSELSYKYALSILVTFPKKCSQVINTPAICLTARPTTNLAGGWGWQQAWGWVRKCRHARAYLAQMQKAGSGA